MAQMNIPTKQKQTHRHREQTYGCQEEWRGRRGMDWEFGVNICKQNSVTLDKIKKTDCDNSILIIFIIVT